MPSDWHKVAVVTSPDPYETCEEIKDHFNGDDARVVSDETDGEVYIERSYDMDHGWFEIASESNNLPDPGEQLSELVRDHSMLEDNDYRLVFDYTNDRYAVERYDEE